MTIEIQPTNVEAGLKMELEHVVLSHTSTTYFVTMEENINFM